MQLESERLILRPFIPSDWKALFQYLSDEDVVRYLPEWECTEESAKALAESRSRDFDYCAVILKESGAMIGHVVLHPCGNPKFKNFELGYVFDKNYHGKGYAYEASRLVMEEGFVNRGVHRILATCDTENPASYKLMERLGMRREAHHEKYLYLRAPKDGEEPEWRGEYIYAILKEEWQNLKKRLTLT